MICKQGTTKQPAIIFLEINSRKMETYFHIKMCIGMLIGTLFLVPKPGHNPDTRYSLTSV